MFATAPLPHRKGPGFLVIRSGAIGDTLMVTPLLRSLRLSFPDAYIGMVTSVPAADAVRFNPNVDQVFSLAIRRLPNALSLEKGRIRRAARLAGVATVLSLESDPNFTSLALSIGAPRVITYDRSAAPGPAEIVGDLPAEHSIDRHLRAGSSVGSVPAGRHMDLYYPTETDALIADKLHDLGIEKGKMVVGIHAGWGRGAQDPVDTRLRSWPGENFAEIARWLYKAIGAKVVLTGSGQDRKVNDFIIRSSGVPAINLAGKLSFPESAAIIRRMDLLLSVDSGPAHMAAALGTPLLALWGPGIFTATAPVSERSIVGILRGDPPCAPCYGTPMLKICRDNVCMKQITADQVRDEIVSILDTAANDQG